MTRAAERLAHRLARADEDVGAASHVSRDQHRLPEIAIGRRHLRPPWPEGARRSLAMNAQALTSALHDVGLHLGDVVADVVQQARADLARREAEHALEHARRK